MEVGDRGPISRERKQSSTGLAFWRTTVGFWCPVENMLDLIPRAVKTHLHRQDFAIQSLSHGQLFDPMDWACQASLSFTISHSFLKLMSIKLVMPSNHLVLCCPLLLLPSIFPSIRVFSNELALCIRWPKYWGFSSSLSPSSEYSGLISFMAVQQIIHTQS